MKKRNIILAISVICMGLALAGGTFAFLTVSFNATNGIYNEKVECFDIDYSITNDDNSTTQLGGSFSGILFPSATVAEGISGRVSMNVNSNCKVTGTGTLTLYVNNATSSTLVQTAAAHCENATTLESMSTKNYTTSASCTSAGGTWVTNGSALKYAVYTNSEGTGTPVAKGYITSSFRGNTTPIYSGFTVNNTQQNFYVFVWLDGWITNNSYNSLPFSGYIHANITQTE